MGHVIVRALLAAGLALAGCTATTGRPAPVDEAAVYAAVLGGGPGNLYVYNRFCTGMINLGSRGDCAAGSISPSLQRRIIAITGPHVQFTSHPPQPSLRAPTMRLGTITMSRGRALVATDDNLCGPLCGSGQTEIIEWTGREWRVTGTTGMSWIS